MHSRVGSAALGLSDERGASTSSSSRTSKLSKWLRPAPPRQWIERVLFVLVLAIAFGLRTYKLDQPTMWCDEAESAINSLSILEHGFPVDHYLGQPIFENMLTEPWPQSAEYEFRDSSYSKGGVAIYHGWIPLYAMAASQWMFGIAPATDPSKLTVTLTPAQISRKSIAARMPSVIFGMIFVVLVYVMGREMYGKDAGWAAMLTAAIAVPVVHVSRQARYYSLTVTLCAACTLLVWRVVTRGRWRDYIAAAICASMLFHTHALTFVIVCIVGVLMLPLILRQQPDAWSKLLVAGAIVFVAVVPWGVLTGFFGSATHIPTARSTMDLPKDLFIYAIHRWPIVLFLVCGVSWLLIVKLCRQWVPKRLADTFDRAGWPGLFLACWCTVAWLAFMLLIPAASLWLHRAYLGMLGAGIVVTSILFATFSRILERRISLPLCCGLLLGFLYYNSKACYTWTREADKTERVLGLLDYMRSWPIKPGTRIYSTPGDQLIVTCYSDVPVQSVAAVRRSYLDNYPGELVILECFNRLVPVEPESVREAAKRDKVDLTVEEAQSWARRLTIRGHADYIRPLVAEVDVPDEKLPSFAADLLRRQRELTIVYSDVIDNPVSENPAVFRGYPMPDYSWWWQVFFYRFAGIEQRTGDQLNYLPRLKNARAVVLPGTYVVYFSPPPASAQQATKKSSPELHISSRVN